ncbi:hypothetical protein PFMALIP_06257 [Plasmodium falciparum MaliPS096_E11]|uniref:Surface antigen n=1 Tax=Plasmodium falciparum MaliPS096_E11 TaxID=1036727 RepID=A0A024WFP1_PLAFA|nr:hypothetical protein PFMALIP_06257 [Plasmodium falciparum MaliPS096_E11]
MKVHYINILLFAFTLNKLVNTHKKLSITARHTQKIPTTRSLSECELYMSNYDNDPEMKRVMQQFHDRTTKRFQEYDESLQEKRQMCKEQCDREIQKIILKDKLEKELTEKFSALHTDIHSDAIPTCICEKSLADKVEKGCLRCTYGLGTLAPTVGLIGSVAVGAWKPKALEAAIAAALKANDANILAAGVEAGEIAGKEAVIEGLKKMGISTLGGKDLGNYFATTPYKNVASIAKAVYEQHFNTCAYDSSGIMRFPFPDANRNIPICRSVWQQTSVVSRSGEHISPDEIIKRTVQNMVSEAEGTANAAAEIAESTKIATIKEAEEKTIEAASTQLYGAIGYSILAILIIVLIMLIIYLILRYRRKKKMKKKAQYTKLLNE